MQSIIMKDQYLRIPVRACRALEKLEIFLDGEKIREFLVPDAKGEEGACDYVAKLHLPEAEGKEIQLAGSISEALLADIASCSDDDRSAECREGEVQRPRFHLTAQSGWINDPNGLIYHDGLYHHYFQHNPLDTQWQNMSWGHAVSRDLLHWEQKETVLWPKEDGTIFSGSAAANERGLLGLPESAILYFYTVAGGTSEWSAGREFVQKMAYSADGGFTLSPLDSGQLGVLKHSSRDPKVFWHEESGAYIMILWVEKDIFGLFRSEDLRTWSESQRFSLPEGYECPDMVRFEWDGNAYWAVMTAAGHYYPGSFDGYRFEWDGYRKELYCGSLQYAAQTFSGSGERIILVPWLRMKHSGRIYCGASGLPRELRMEKEADRTLCIVQRPVREYELARQETESGAGACEAELTLERSGSFCILTGGITVCYDGKNGIFRAGEECWETESEQAGEKRQETESAQAGEKRRETESAQAGEECRKTEGDFLDFRLIADDTILEVSMDGGKRFGAVELPHKAEGFLAESMSGIKNLRFWKMPDAE